jgi:hypothetical protein
VVSRRFSLALWLLLSSGCDGNIVNQTGGSDDDDETEEGAPNLVVDPLEVNFGDISLGSTGSATMTLQNNGTGTLTVTSIESDSSAFEASGGAGLELSPGTTTTVGLTCSPSDYGETTGTISIITNDPDEPSMDVTVRGTVVTDSDTDGFDSESAGGTDCDDSNAEVYPGADDEWYDGVDGNCDGADDYDQDGDGYQTITHNDDPDAGGGDCQDVNADINPGETDIWYDGVDTDCDGWEDYDQDGDGYEAEEYGVGNDCNDVNADVNPDAEEMFNGLDDDCDGASDLDVDGYNADVTYYGTDASDYAGSAVALGDLDNDGYAEVIVGSYYYSSGRGAVSVFDGAHLAYDQSEIDEGDSLFTGDGSSDYLGAFVGYSEDATGDGAADLIVGAPGTNGSYGALYVIDGDDVRGVETPMTRW